MRPDIYPRTLENIKAVLLYYFPKTSHSEIDKNAERIYDERKFRLNELEYCCEIVSKNENVIRQFYKVINLNILLIVGYTVLFEDIMDNDTRPSSQKAMKIREVIAAKND